MSTHAEIFQEAHDKLQAQDAEGARALFLQAAELKGLDLASMLATGQQQLIDGDVADAAETLLEVFEANPTDIGALLGLARGALFIGQPDDADAYLLGVMRMEPDNVEGILYQGLVHEAKGDLVQAQAWLERAVEGDAENYLAHFNLGRVLAQREIFDGAVAMLTCATELAPDNYDAHYALGMSHKGGGDLRLSILSFNRCMEISPDNIEIYATLADVLCAARDLDTAADVLNAGLNQTDEHPGLLQKAAAVASQAGLFEAAVGYMERVVEKLPNYHQAWINLALYYILVDELEKSEEAAKRAIEIDSEHWEGYYHLGNLFEAVKLFDKAVEEYRKAIERAPAEEYRPELNLAAVLIEMDDEERNEDAMGIFDKYELTREAMEILVPLAERDNGDWRPHYNLALAHAKLNQTKEAIELLEELFNNEPEGTALYDAAFALRQNVFSTSDEVKRTQVLSTIPTISSRGDDDPNKK